MDHLRSLRHFVRALELGSLGAAAREAGLSQPTLSKTLAALERELGVRLLERSPSGLAPTDAGQRFYDRAKYVLDEWGEAVDEARNLTEHPVGKLRISAPVGLGETHLNGWILTFLKRYPGIEIELILNDQYIDLIEDGVDLAVRLGGQLPPNVIARKIATVSRPIVAAPDYLFAHEPIQTPNDLLRHNYIRFAWLTDGDRLELSSAQGVQVIHTRGRYRVNSSLAVRDSLVQGLGVGAAPYWLVQPLLASGALVHVLPAWRATPLELHLVYASRRYQPLRTRIFMDFITEQICAESGFSTYPSQAETPV